MKRSVLWILFAPLILSMLAYAASGCRSETTPEDEHGEAEALVLPELEAVDLGGESLRVVATTSIVGDVVGQLGRNAIALTTLMGPGQDPHSYKSTAQDMVAVSEAHVIFVNGWDLEEALVQDLEEIGENTPLVPISANCEPLAFGGGETDDHHEGTDPHTWFSVRNVQQWAANVERVLSDLDPANAGMYASNAVAYRVDLAELETYVETRLSSIPPENRFLVTNHDSFGYLAQEYDLKILGTVIPTASSMAEPSASDLVELIARMAEHSVCTLFTEATVSDKMAQMVATELDGCDEVRVYKLYTGAVGPAGSGADSYIGMMHYNVDAIVAGLE
jgi:ABC-type Zn uptake system ZnuABC Zn-binding protein ZnuA